jgi:hypothetical protein
LGQGQLAADVRVLSQRKERERAAWNKRESMSKQYPSGCGVYMATMPNRCFYVGRSINIYQRICNHYSDAKRGVHRNKWLANSLNKYGKKVKWEVLLNCDNEQDALSYERQYLEFWWGSDKLMNMKKGDSFTALENERNKRKPVYAMNVWTGGVVRFNYRDELSHLIGGRRGRKLPQSVYGNSIEECNKQRLKKMKSTIKQEESKVIKLQQIKKRSAKHRLRYKYHVRNIYTAYVGVATLSDLRSWGVNPHNGASFQNGWQYRRFGTDWTWDVNCYKQSVFGLHVSGVQKQWPSLTSCETDLGEGAGNVFRGQGRTYKGWRLC